MSEPANLDEEIAQFDGLKPRLERLWREVFPADEEHYTSVVIPSVTVEPDVLRAVPGASFFEESLLFFMIRLRNPKARLVYVTSRPIHPMVLEYYLHFLAGIPASHAQKRLALLAAYDASPQPLTLKVLERPRLMQRILDAIPDRERAYLITFNVTPLERRLAVRLGLPINGADPRWDEVASRSGGRRLLREAGLEPPPGLEDLHDEADLVNALQELRAQRPGITRAVLRANHSFWGEGVAEYRYPEDASQAALKDALREVVPSVAQDDVASFFEKYLRRGGSVEERITGGEVRSVSAQVRVNPRGQVSPAATHEEATGGPTGLVNTGCCFPAADDYRAELQDIGQQVGRQLAAQGVVSRVSVDCVAQRADPASPWRLTPVGFNFGVGGTTHPLLAVRFLAGGRLDRESGLFHSASGRPKYYRADDELASPAYRGLLPDDLIELITLKGLNYSPNSEAGALFYMMGALSEHGRVGVVAIGNSRQEAEEVYERTVEVLNAATR